jgi:hypothetical protein
MPLHKITGLLNNCALNSALPHLLHGISKLAELEAAGGIDNLADNEIIQRYTQLKNLYAAHYGIDRNLAFNWCAFHRFLSAHSFYANEIMFAPVFRHFIAEMGLASGRYSVEGLPLLRDVQPDGRYIMMDVYATAALFHNQFGLSLRTYEFIHNRETENSEDNYRLVSEIEAGNRVYPFIYDTPLVSLYLKDNHFEIQPHELLAEPVSKFIAEIKELPPALLVIHERLSCSQRDLRSNEFLGHLVVYVHQALTAQLRAATQPLPAAAVLSDDVQIINDLDNAQKYVISAEEYAVLGCDSSHKSASGRQTFAVILLIILNGCGEKKAQTILEHLRSLSDAAVINKPLASYLLDKLALAIIESKADLEAAAVKTAIQNIELDNKANREMLTIERSSHNKEHKDLVTKTRELNTHLWQNYNDTKNDDLIIEIIKLMQAVSINPSLQSVQNAHTLQSQVKDRSQWGEFIAGLMLSIIGLAMVLVGCIGAVSTLGMSLPVAAPIVIVGMGSLGAGISFFNSSRDTGEDKEMQSDYAHVTI